MSEERTWDAKAAVDRDAKTRIDNNADERRKLRQIAQANPLRPWVAEEAKDPNRLQRFVSRMARERGGDGAEAVQGSTIDYQPIVFLSEGARVSHTVALVTVQTPEGARAGSGFMISPGLFITNHHVIEDKDQARRATVEFNFELDPSRQSVPPTRFQLDPDRCFVTRPETDLDFTVVAIGARMDGNTDLKTIGFCALSDADDKHAIGMPVNIVQHPEARPKVVVVRNNMLVDRTEHTLLYETDTDHGSSGSPVFNDSWDVVALHHYGEAFLANRDRADNVTRPCNEGIRISTIVTELRKEAHPLVHDALDRVSQPAPRVPVIEAGGEAADARTSAVDGDGVYRLTVPLEITVRIGTTPARSPVEPRTAKRAPAIVRPSSAEKVVIDTSYSNRQGYKEDFLETFKVAMPGVEAHLVAPLKQGAHASDGLLQYEHFSIRMHNTRQMALFTATNVDGPTYLEIDRKTGQPAKEGGETWFPDPRIDAKYFIDQTFYSDWSEYFDRGHLTRRSDPTWGDRAASVRANADTFHFTNCTPQHFRFNESSKFWQGVERYVLEKGGLERQKKLCVLQGPVLLGEHAKCDDILVPLKFWKIVVWVGAGNTPRCAGFIVSQEKIINESRTAIKPASSTTPIQVDMWRATIPAIATATGLDFHDLAKYDTFKTKDPVGEGIRLITNLEQIQL